MQKATRSRHRGRQNEEAGYILLGVFILVGLLVVIAGGLVDSSTSVVRTRAVVATQTRQYYQVEETLNRVVGWLQANSKSIVPAFTSANFNNHFELGPPTIGDNEGDHFETPTMVKVKGTNNAVLLSNNTFFGVSDFPATQHMDTGASFNAVQEFENADLGEANARVVLVWARETNGNFEPIFRVDVVTGNNPDRGVHSYSYVYSTLSSGGGDVGFYGQDFLTFQTPNNDCFSYLYMNSGAGNWWRGAPRSNCPVGSDSIINISSDINGTALSLASPGISLNPPGGAVSGETCEGLGCHTINLTPFLKYQWRCLLGGTDIVIDKKDPDVTLNSGGCYRDVSIANGKKLILTDTTTPYVFRFVDFRSNFAQLAFGDIPPGEDIEVFIEQVSNDHMNGNQFYALNNAPHQVKLNYTGDAAFTFNGTARFNAFVEAPYADITVNGNFIYYGGIKAKSLTIAGKARVNYDESAGAAPSVSDVKFSLKKASQRYR